MALLVEMEPIKLDCHNIPSGNDLLFQILEFISEAEFQGSNELTSGGNTPFLHCGHCLRPLALFVSSILIKCFPFTLCFAKRSKKCKIYLSKGNTED